MPASMAGLSGNQPFSGRDAFSMNSQSVKSAKKKRKFSKGKSAKSTSVSKKGKKKGAEGPNADDEKIKDNIEALWSTIDNIGNNFMQFIDCLKFTKDLYESLG